MDKTNTVYDNKMIGSFLRLSSVFALGLPLAVITNIVLARILPIAEYGKYGLAIAFASVVSIPVVSGMPMLLMREVSGYHEERQWPRYRALMMSAWVWSIGVSLALILGCLAYLRLSGAETLYGMPLDLLLTSLLIAPILGGISIAGGALRGFGFASYAALPQQIVLQLLLITGFLFLSQLDGFSGIRALRWYLAANVIVMLILILLLQIRSPVEAGVRGFDYADWSSWRNAYLPFMAVGAIGTLTTNLAILLMGYYGLEEGVAYLRVAERGAQLVTFPLIVLNIVIGPRIVQHWKREDTDGLRALAQNSTRMLLLFNTPIALTLVLFGGPILRLTFGEEYADTAYWPMVILVAAQLIFSALGSAGPILAMTGNERVIILAQVVGLVMLVVSAVLLIPRYGAIGGAISATAGLLTMKILLVAIVWHRHSFWPGVRF